MLAVRSVLCLVLIGAIANGRKLPSFVQQCKAKYPEVNLCIKTAIQDIKSRLPNGIPEMHIPKLEPFEISETTLSSGESLTATFKNAFIKRTSNFIVKSVDFDVEHNRASLRVSFPIVEFSADYNIVGRVLVLQLNGSGASYGNATDVDATVYITGKKKIIRAKEHLLFDKVKIDLKFGGGWLHFDDLFRGNRELSVRLNEIINNNILDVLGEIKPLIEHATGEVVLNLIKGVFERYSIDELFVTN